jgi:hypothetical protein
VSVCEILEKTAVETVTMLKEAFKDETMGVIVSKEVKCLVKNADVP